MKKRLIALAFLMVLLLTACGGGSGGSGSKHPYSWKEKRDGSIELTIKNAPEEGYAWNAVDTNDGVFQMERTDDGSGNRAVFSLTSERPVSGILIFDCRRQADPGDTSFEIQLRVEPSNKGKLSVAETTYQEFPPVETVGLEGSPSCSWYSDPGGTEKLYLDSVSGWSAMEYDETILSIGLPDYGEVGCTYTLTGLAAGETSLLMYDLQEDYGFRLSVTVADDLSVTLKDGEAGTFEIPAGQIPGMEAITAYIGQLPIPSGYRIVGCRSGDWNGVGQETNYASLNLSADGREWVLYATKDYSMAAFADLWLNGDTAGQTETAVNGYRAVLYREDGRCMLFWADDQGRSFCLRPRADTAEQEELLAAANGLYGQKGA